MWKTITDRILKIKVCVPEGKTGVELNVLFLPGNVLCFLGCLSTTRHEEWNVPMPSN